LIEPMLSGLFGSDGSSGIFGTLTSSFDSLLSNLFHDGGVVGVDSTATRSVSPGVFANAPRLHGGLMSDEFPAILQKGESVFTESQTQALGAMVGGGTSLNLELQIENKGEPVSAKQSGPVTIDANQKKMVVGIVLEAMENNTGNFKNTLKAKLSA